MFARSVGRGVAHIEPMRHFEDRLMAHLEAVYGHHTAVSVLPRLLRIIESYQPQLPEGAQTAVFSEQDSILITYGDQLWEADRPPLQTLADFCQRWINGRIQTVHLLPFYPYSSDDGFSVIDYKAVNPELGSWADIEAIGKCATLMFDAVINHISARSDWFHRFLQDDPHYQAYFTVVDPAVDLTAVFRPRALPLLTPFQTPSGIKYVWTTFSADQIDLNYANPDVLLEIVDTLLFYIAKGAQYIRLDAIGFMWKEIGTSCIHLPQAHRLIQLMRSVLDGWAPHVKLITETNVPHQENISYFGDGTNEAQMVYNFSLPPLTLHAFHTGNAEFLTEWADTLTLPSDAVTFFNFLASHDGIGVTPARGILPDGAVQQMAQRVIDLGGFVSYKNNDDGTQSAYELNINYLDALGDPTREEPMALIVDRFLTSQAIMLALRGVPGIYFHSLFGSRGWLEGVQESGRFRTINREKLSLDELEAALTDPNSLRYQLFNGYARLLEQRTRHAAFHPNGPQEIIRCHPAIFALHRRSPTGDQSVLCLHNVSGESQSISVPVPFAAAALVELINGRSYPVVDGQLTVQMAPYQRLWLSPDDNRP